MSKYYSKFIFQNYGFFKIYDHKLNYETIKFETFLLAMIQICKYDV